MSFRTYRQVTGEDHSDLAGQVAAQRDRVRHGLAGVRTVVAIMSGKGGVGKSQITAALALAMAEAHPGGVGVLDADLKAPTVAHLLGARGGLVIAGDVVEPAEGERGIRVVSSSLLLAAGAPLSWRGNVEDGFVWRGALEAGMLRELLADVAWGALDVLLVDLPPDADRAADLAALISPPRLAGVIAVTLPSEESRAAVERSMHAARGAGIRLLGIVENMSGIACAECGRLAPAFIGQAGADLAALFDCPLLARVPLLPGATPAALAPHLAVALRTIEDAA